METQTHVTAQEQCERLKSSPVAAHLSFPGSPIFLDEQAGNTTGYWSNNERDVTPACRITPKTANDVSKAVTLLAPSKCGFAVRGGGHMFWAGAANIQDGVTIDLSEISRIHVTQDRKIVAVGAGARWQDVYAKLGPMNLSAVGGRAGTVGVAGLTLGGGNSYFAPRYGIACDGVASYEVVLADGRVVTASPTHHPDLYRALRGGGNNFGIVTKFSFRAFEQGNVWAGFIIHPPSTTAENLDRLQAFNTKSGNGIDNYATENQVHTFNSTGRSFIINIVVYTKPETDPEILRPFIGLQPQLSNDMRITNLSDIVKEGTPPPGARYTPSVHQLQIPSSHRLQSLTFSLHSNCWASFSFANNATILSHVLSMADEAFAPIRHIPGFSGIFSFQPMNRQILRHMSSYGGNALGLDPGRDIFWLNYGIAYTSPADDSRVYALTRAFFEQVERYTRSQGQHIGFIYMNYALPTQEVIASYGRANVEFLRGVGGKYDPEGVFQRLVPGGFKLV
ncbi:MAG: hypothetical protein Q9207_005910 [Kuettlingeria erythrocarpa]